MKGSLFQHPSLVNHTTFVVSAYCYVSSLCWFLSRGMDVGRAILYAFIFAPLLVLGNAVLAVAVLFAGCVASGNKL